MEVLDQIYIDENKALLQLKGIAHQWVDIPSCMMHVCINYYVADQQPHLHQLEQLTGPDGSKSVQVITSVAAKWEELAIALDFDAPAIAVIKRDYSSDCREACSQMLQMWLKMEFSDASRSVSWATLIQSLKDAEFSSVGIELEEILNLECVV